MKPRLHTFEGEQLTVAEIRKRVPVLAESVVRKHLADGRDTRQAMLAYDHCPLMRAAAQRGRAMTEARGLTFQIKRTASA